METGGGGVELTPPPPHAETVIAKIIEVPMAIVRALFELRIFDPTSKSLNMCLRCFRKA
jgi:hypothetical protein